MRLWTILTEAAWTSLNEPGYLICDDEALGEEHFLTSLSLDDATYATANRST